MKYFLRNYTLLSSTENQATISDQARIPEKECARQREGNMLNKRKKYKKRKIKLKEPMEGRTRGEKCKQEKKIDMTTPIRSPVEIRLQRWRLCSSGSSHCFSFCAATAPREFVKPCSWFESFFNKRRRESNIRLKRVREIDDGRRQEYQQ